MDNILCVEWQALQRFTTAVFRGLGMPPADAELEAEVLVWANLRGVDSHGVQRIAEYSRAVDEGNMNPRPRIRVEKESAAALLVEGDRAFGPVVTVYSLNLAMAKARREGVAWALIRNTTHQGAMGYYTQRAARQGIAAIAVVCNPPNMAPPGARAAGVHNSPISIAVPAGADGDLTLDMATSVAAGGKVQVAVDKGMEIPLDWALDADGRPTPDPRQAKFLQPAGGYKGYGLALMFECLSSLMAGNPLVTSTIVGPEPVRPGTQNSFLAVLDVGFFTDPAEYRCNVDLLIRTEKGLPRLPGVEEILVPGEPEARVLADRLAHGIPLPAGTMAKLQAAAERFGLAVPSPC
ncbi:MAG: Ldh family oxidoreductase [Candidatus Latescibacterota bacterium]|jgi:LDH2 family malate/lactate/ureidoglycolate dehydrogenase